MVRKVYLLFSSPDCLIVCFIFIVTAFLMLFFASLVDCCIRSSSFSPIPVIISFVFVVHELVCWFVIIFLMASSCLVCSLL